MKAAENNNDDDNKIQSTLFELSECTFFFKENLAITKYFWFEYRPGMVDGESTDSFTTQVYSLKDFYHVRLISHFALLEVLPSGITLSSLGASSDYLGTN